MFERFDTHHHAIDRLADANGIVSGIALYPQVFRAVVDPLSRSGLAATTFLLILVSSIVWIVYACHRHNLPLMISSILNVIASGVLVVFALTR